MNLPSLRKIFGSILVVIAIIFVSLQPALQKVANAADFSDFGVTLSNKKAGNSGTNYAVDFTTTTSSLIQKVSFRFSTTLGGSGKPTNMDLTAATLGTVTGTDSTWTLAYDDDAGTIALTRDNAIQIDAATSVSFQLQNITNPALYSCENPNQYLTESCHLKVNTYSDTGTSGVDVGNTTFQIYEDPQFSFEVLGVDNGETHGSFVNGATTTPVKLDFPPINIGQVKYVTQKLVIVTNAPGGYKINVRLDGNLRGSYNNAEISPFGATDASWDSPQIWSSPDGDTPNTNTGWLGANTSDTRVDHWSSATGKFGPVSSIDHTVAQSDGPDRAGSTVYVTYALEVNGAQPADQYTGKLIYDIRPIY